MHPGGQLDLRRDQSGRERKGSRAIVGDVTVKRDGSLHRRRIRHARGRGDAPVADGEGADHGALPVDVESAAQQRYIARRGQRTRRTELQRAGGDRCESGVSVGSGQRQRAGAALRQSAGPGNHPGDRRPLGAGGGERESLKVHRPAEGQVARGCVPRLARTEHDAVVDGLRGGAAVGDAAGIDGVNSRAAQREHLRRAPERKRGHRETRGELRRDAGTP